MIPAADLLRVGYTVGFIAVAAGLVGLIALRLLAARSLAASLAGISAVSVVATLAGVAVIADEMFISRKDLDVVVAVVIIAGISGLGLALLLGRRVSAASRLMLGAVQEAGRGGGYRRPLAIMPAELASLSAEFEMAHSQLVAAHDRERALESSRRELVAWVSHDLRTPLSGLRAMAEALEDGVVADPLTTSKYHAQIRRETDRLALMIDDLFELSRIHAGALRLSYRLVGIGDLIGEALTSTEPLARAKGVRLSGGGVARLPVFVDSAQVGRALANLLVNAIRHTPSDGTVEILGEEDAGMATVSVRDSCGGIPAEHLPRVFDMAFRGESARTPTDGEGAGLGLSIARGIIEAHEGKIAVSNSGAGCLFVISLPLAGAPVVAQ